LTNDISKILLSSSSRSGFVDDHSHLSRVLLLLEKF